MSFVHPEDRARVRNANEESDRTGAPFSQEYRVVARDGTIKWVRDDGVCIKDAEGRPVYWQGSWLDVTTQKEAVEELHASETRFRSIFEHALIGMSLSRPDGQWVEVNAALCSLVGYTEEELLARSFQDVTHPEDLDADLAYVRQLLNGEVDFFRMEKRYIHKNGQIIWVLLSASMVRREDGAPLYYVAQIQDITQQKRSDEELRHQALHDALTDLPNRTLMQDRLEQALIAARRSSDTVALLVMDLNRFKEVNDSLGHAAGDRLLQETTARLTSSLRQSDTVARLGGDEFAIILPDSGFQQAEHIARKLLLALRQPVMLNDHQIDVDASIGVALFPEHGESAETLLRHADVAMYAAKRSRLGHALYAAEHDLSSPGQLALVAGLRDAIEHEKLVLHFQPIVTLSTGRVKCMEALARWQPDGQGFIPPSQFIPLAEETGLIEQLTMFVLRQALAQCAAWNRAGLDLNVAVNLSASSLLNASLSDVIETALQHAGVSGESLVVEVTESALMTKPDEVAVILDRLHRLGIRVAIDDFGIGYSSLSYLQQLPVDEIKIDRSFIQTMAHDEQAIVRTVIELGKNLNLEVTAEGVEDEETWRTLYAMNCSTIQGYYISRPMPAAAVAPWIASYEQHPRRPGA
jgi:diguanylate cyclase (GGDEF)-like protein/PAS domain S-box-containing protein